MLRRLGELDRGGGHDLYGKPPENNFVQQFGDVNLPLNKLDEIIEKLSNFKLPVKVHRDLDTDSISIFLELGKSKEESYDDLIEFEKYYESIINEIKN